MLYYSFSRALLFSLGLFAALSTFASANVPSGALQQRHENNEPTSASSSHPQLHPAEPLLELNETEILRWHARDPLSYWSHDFEAKAGGVDSKSWRALMVLHVIGMSFAFFIVLPIGISLRSVKHRWHGAAVAAFIAILSVSSGAGSLYKKLTGDLYEGSAHGRGGYLVLILALALATCDAAVVLQRALNFIRDPQKKNIRFFWQSVVLNRRDASSPEYASLAHVLPDEDTRDHVLRNLDEGSKESVDEWINQEEWPQSAASGRSFLNHNRQNSEGSINSEDTLHAPTLHSRAHFHDSHDSYGPRSWLSRLGHAVFATAERSLVIFAFVELLSGVTVYTGICRQNYINGCMAHLIKGGIFWCYGLLAFGRYLGAWADLGWAWNRLPVCRAKKIPSAESVESFVIFLYGATNVWMERFGAEPDSPFTTKQLQHISIAVMFLFAGMLGLTLESKTFRRWLSSRAQSVVKPGQQVSEPPSYAASFNPFPALVIGVTGAAMSAHHQTYRYQLQIHALWGFFLIGFAVLRCLTYFFLWIRPPHSVLPSRPPTEALASFFLTSGGLVFIFSTEQITFAAMRRGLDDVMFIFNLAVAVTCLALCWVMSITAFKGWVAHRARASSLAHLSHKDPLDEHIA